MRRDLNEASGLRQIDGCVTNLTSGVSMKISGTSEKLYFGQEDGVNLGAMLEVRQNAHSLNLSSASVNIQFIEAPCICLVCHVNGRIAQSEVNILLGHIHCQKRQ